MADNPTTKGYAPFDLYPYNPAQPPAFAFTAMFAIAALLHVIATIPYRSWFPIPIIIGSGMEAAAYYFRSQSHDDIRKTLPFLLQNLLLLAAPPFIAASIYMSPRRLARAIDGEDLLLAPRVLTKLFVVIDTVCFVTQVAGAIMSGSENPEEAQRGKTIIIVGLVLQIVAFAFFTLWTLLFQRRMATAPRTTELSDALVCWRRYVYGLYGISLLFVVRNVVRLIEYNQGPGSEMLRNEVYLYALEGSTMVIVVFMFVVLHPGRLRMKARKYGRKMDLSEAIPLGSASS